MSIGEESLLLLLDGRTGKLTVDGMQAADPVLAGAILVDLVLGRFVDAAEQGEHVEAGRIVVRNGGPANDPVLKAALALAVSEEGCRPTTVPNKVGRGLRPRLLEQLVAAGAVTTATTIAVMTVTTTS